MLITIAILTFYMVPALVYSGRWVIVAVILLWLAL